MSNTNKDPFTDAVAGTDPNAVVIVDTTADSAGQPITLSSDAVTGRYSAAGADERRIAEFVNPTDYEDYWRTHFYASPQYVSGCVWNDYRPAYRLGYDAYFSNHGRKFDDVEFELARGWEAIKDSSHLTWSQAKYAVRDGWRFVEDAVTGGSADRRVQ